MKSILVVDDDANFLELIDFVLKKNNFKTILMESSIKALQVAKKQHPDLIILDSLLPGIHGADVCKQLKSDSATRDIPILFLSAMVDEKEAEAGLRAGAAAYLFKPFKPEVVLEKIDELLSKNKEIVK